MIARYLNALAICALLGSAVYAYSIKYETMRYSAEIEKAKHNLARERDRIGMLKAEWAHLSRPERVQALADQHLDLQPISVDQYVDVSVIPTQSAKVDAIGRKLEALGISEPTTTPRDERAAIARPASSTPNR